MIGAVRCAEGWCETATDWNVGGLVFGLVGMAVSWWVVRRG